MEDGMINTSYGNVISHGMTRKISQKVTRFLALGDITGLPISTSRRDAVSSAENRRRDKCRSRA